MGTSVNLINSAGGDFTARNGGNISANNFFNGRAAALDGGSVDTDPSTLTYGSDLLADRGNVTFSDGSQVNNSIFSALGQGSEIGIHGSQVNNTTGLARGNGQIQFQDSYVYGSNYEANNGGTVRLDQAQSSGNTGLASNGGSIDGSGQLSGNDFVANQGDIDAQNVFYSDLLAKGPNTSVDATNAVYDSTAAINTGDQSSEVGVTTDNTVGNTFIGAADGSNQNVNLSASQNLGNGLLAMASGQGSTVDGQLDNSALTNVFLQALNGGSVDFVGNGMVGSQTQGLTNGGQVSLDQFATFGTNTFGSSGPGQFTEVVTNNIVNSIIQATSSPQQQG